MEYIYIYILHYIAGEVWSKINKEQQRGAHSSCVSPSEHSESGTDLRHPLAKLVLLGTPRPPPRRRFPCGTTGPLSLTNENTYMLQSNLALLYDQTSTNCGKT